MKSKEELTINDLIVEYMIAKVKGGYEPTIKTSEFIDFLKYFENYIVVDDISYDEDIFKKFYEYKKSRHWDIVEDYKDDIHAFIPHMFLTKENESNEYVLKANYRLSPYDLSVINTYFMDNGLGRFGEGKVQYIREYINDYLLHFDKRELPEVKELSDDEIMVGKYYSYQIVQTIWQDYLEKLIRNHLWPIRCTDMKKFLIDNDLANLIGVESIKDELIDIYQVMNKRIASFYKVYKNVGFSMYESKYLARANYELLIKDYEYVFNRVFGVYFNHLDISISGDQSFIYGDQSFLEMKDLLINEFASDKIKIKK